MIDLLRHVQPQRVFVSLREHIGDVVNSTAALHCLRQRFPTAHLCVEVGEQAAPVLQNFPGIDDLWLRPTHQGVWGKVQFIWRLRKGCFDLAVILDDSADMVLHAWLGGIPLRVGVSRKPKFRSLYAAFVPHAPSRHETLAHFRDLVALLGCDLSDYRPRLYPSSEDQQFALTTLQQAGWDGKAPLVGVHPSASRPHRQWFPDRFAQVCDALSVRGAQCVVLGGPGDKQLVEEILRHCRSQPLVLTGRLTVLQLAALMPCLRLLITADSGPMHIAAAMGTKVVALYGLSDPAYTGPFGEGHVIIRYNEPCVGCTAERCLHDRECMKRISVEEVVNAAMRYVAAE
ncbi:MAG: glycosyltransferase family 9 protein [Armatimonadetes bacterium]|nr:glycosyltransferase family 9 protein [Armatimonadota bacterium]